MKIIRTTDENNKQRQYFTTGKKELYADIVHEADNGRFLCAQDWGDKRTLRYSYCTIEQIRNLGGWERRKTFLGGRNIPIYEIHAAKNKSQDQSYEAVDSQD